MKGKPKWQCMTRLCGEPRADGDSCASCAETRGKVAPARYTCRPAPQREIRTVVYPTGLVRRMDGRREMAYTDGKQVWWAAAMGAA